MTRLARRVGIARHRSARTTKRSWLRLSGSLCPQEAHRCIALPDQNPGKTRPALQFRRTAGEVGFRRTRLTMQPRSHTPLTIADTEFRDPILRDCEETQQTLAQSPQVSSPQRAAG